MIRSIDSLRRAVEKFSIARSVLGKIAFPAYQRPEPLPISKSRLEPFSLSVRRFLALPTPGAREERAVEFPILRVATILRLAAPIAFIRVMKVIARMRVTSILTRMPFITRHAVRPGCADCTDLAVNADAADHRRIALDSHRIAPVASGALLDCRTARQRRRLLSVRCRKLFPAVARQRRAVFAPCLRRVCAGRWP